MFSPRSLCLLTTANLILFCPLNQCLLAQLSGEVIDGSIIIQSAVPTPVRGIELLSPNGRLVPSRSPDSAPFEFLLSNSPHQVTWGNLGTNALLEGAWGTGIGFQGTTNEASEEILGVWAIETEQFPLPFGSPSGTPPSSPGRDSLLPEVGTSPTVISNPINTGSPVSIKRPQVEGPIGVFVNPAGQLVLDTNGYELEALHLSSSSGSLIPAKHAAPFASLESNSARQIAYLSPRPLNLTGGITLSAGWDSSRGSVTVIDDNQVTLFSGRPSPCGTTCPPMLNVTFDEEQRIVLHGSGQSLTSLDFFSGGSLVPAEDAAPFEALLANTTEHIAYRTPAGLKIDGSLRLSSGWSANGVIGDITYEFVDVDGNRTSGLAIPTDYFLEDRHLDAIVTDENQIQLTGTGHRVNSVQFTSRSGSLVPGLSSDPFDSLGENSPNSVRLFQSEGNIRLDGEIVLDVGWDPNGQQDLKFEYDGVGNWPSGSYYLSRGSYPAGNGGPRPEAWISLDEDYRVILHADGKRLLGMDLFSKDSSLVPPDSPDPFSFFLKNAAYRQTLGTLANSVEVDGSIRTEIRVNPFLKADEIDAAYGGSLRVDGQVKPIEIEVLKTDLAICPGCAVPEVAFSTAGQMWVEGFEEPISEIQITSASGSLIPLNIDAHEFATTLASDSEIHLTATGGVDAFLQQMLPVGWEAAAGAEDIYVEFTMSDGTRVGPFDLASEVYHPVIPGVDLPSLALGSLPDTSPVVPEPSTATIAISALLILACSVRPRRERE